MTLPTGVQAVAENNYGRPNEALKYLKKMSRTFSYALPGSMYEVSPDYGMIAQAWNIYGFAIPIVQQFFGISPQASKKKVLINPHMPDEWNDASLENVIIADNKVSVFYSNSDGLLKLKVIQQNADWAVEIGLPDNHETGKYKVLKSSVEPVKQENRFVFSSKKKTTEIVLQLSRQ
jgi:hypothetical protein